MPDHPFDLDGRSPAAQQCAAVVRPVLSWLLRLRVYRALYERIKSNPDKPFEQRALETLAVRAIASEKDVARIPTRGPLLIAANHPHGALDGLVLASIVRQRRSDVRILTNHLLSRIPELAELCFFVDPFEGPSAAARSHAGLRAAHLWLRQGGALVVFPAGEVAHRPGTASSRADSPWRSTVGRLVLTTGATVLPAFIEGTNSMLFYAAGRVHPALRTALLARELLKKRGEEIRVCLGTPLSATDFAEARGDAAAVTQVVRGSVEQLQHGSQTLRATLSEPEDALQREISRLPAESCLAQSGAFQVYLAEASEIPTVLPEIGRLREITYRAVGEGTGRHLDLDSFDRRYVHLFAWDRAHKQIVGAYRIGQTDRIVATTGIDGLYTRTLFRYDERLIARLSPALELGRSFVRAEYQKNYNALLALWKGIGQFIVRHPQYRVLFGPVSISSRYSDGSHALLMAFLQQNHLDRDLADLVAAINPGHMNPAPMPTAPRSLQETDRLIAAAEADGKGIPILLRQYLKLNAKLLGFNVDPRFGDALDALMMVDLTMVDPAILNRYLGRHGAERFLAHHRGARSGKAA